MPGTLKTVFRWCIFPNTSLKTFSISSKIILAQLEPRDISYAYRTHLLFQCLNRFEIFTEHSSMTAMHCEKCQSDLTAEEWIMGRGGFMRFAFNMRFGRTFYIAPRSVLLSSIYCIDCKWDLRHFRGLTIFFQQFVHVNDIENAKAYESLALMNPSVTKTIDDESLNYDVIPLL